jgi:phosphoglycerate dehydrogenase-like enzyme
MQNPKLFPLLVDCFDFKKNLARHNFRKRGQTQTNLEPDIYKKGSSGFWNPPVGLIPRLPALCLLQCRGAGIDHLIAHRDLHQGIQIARLVDHFQARDLATFVLGHAIAWYRRFD